MPEWIYLANWTPERKTINPARNKPAGWSFWPEKTKCAERRLLYYNRWRAWVEKWPEHCDKCGASGVVEWSENAAPFGSGECWPMRMTDACDNCFGNQSVCPRCGGDLYGAIVDKDSPEDPYAQFDKWLDAEGACPLCGWQWGKHNNDDIMPWRMEECDCMLDSGLQQKKPGKWQLWVFERFGWWFQFLFKHPIWIMRGRNE